MIPMGASSQSVFRDRSRDASLFEDSFVVTPFLHADEVARLAEEYTAVVGTDGSGIQIDFIRDDRALVRRLHDIVVPVLSERVAELFEDLVPVAASFVAKFPGDDSALFLHRDIPVNDERSGRCFTLWSPLVDVSPEAANGCLEVVPRSERLSAAAMGPATPLLFAAYQPEFERRRRPVTMKAGEALVFDTRTLHGSPPNTSDRMRLAVGCALARRDLTLVRIHATGRRHRQVVSVDADFFIDRHPLDTWDRVPDGLEIIDEFEDVAELTPEEVCAVLGVGSVTDAVAQIPSDLSASGSPLTEGPLIQLPPVTVLHDRDLRATAADLDPPSVLNGPVSVVSVPGVSGGAPGGGAAVGVRAVTDAVARPIATWPPALELLSGHSTGLANSTLVIVDPGARARIDSPDPLAITVLECPAIRSGARTTDGAVGFDLGHRRRIPAGNPVTIWNEGPGPLVVLLHADDPREDSDGREVGEPATAKQDGAA